MKEYIQVGDTVEGQKCEIYTRKENFKGLREDPITKETMSVYELSRNCSVEVRESLIHSAEDEKLREPFNVHGNVGDKLKGDAITMYVDQKRKLVIDVREGLTSTHGAHLISTKKRTIGVIKYPFPIFEKLLGFSANSIENTIK